MKNYEVLRKSIQGHAYLPCVLKFKSALLATKIDSTIRHRLHMNIYEIFSKKFQGYSYFPYILKIKFLILASKIDRAFTNSTKIKFAKFHENVCKDNHISHIS